MATGYVVSGRGDLDVLFKARTSAAGSNTGFKSNGAVDLAQRFEPRGAATAIAATGFTVGGTDLASTFQDINYSPPFTPITRTYKTAVNSASETVPAGATTCVITLYGGGGGGGMKLSATGGGGGGGSKGVKTLAVSGGQIFTYTVAAIANGATTQGSSGVGGRFSQVTRAAVSLNVLADGGGPGTFTPTGGAGGVCTGGDTNTNGTAGLATGAGGAAASGGGAGGSGDGGFGTAPGGGGAGGISTGSGQGGRGAAGQVQFAYT